MMKYIRVSLFSVLILFSTAITFSGCTVTFTQSDALQLGLSETAEQTMLIVAEFEAGEADSVAGDVTQKAGSACAGGECIIY